MSLKQPANQPIAEQRGSKDFLRGIRFDENPYRADKQILKHCAWNVGYRAEEKKVNRELLSKGSG